MKQGADVNKRDRDNKTALDYVSDISSIPFDVLQQLPKGIHDKSLVSSEVSSNIVQEAMRKDRWDIIQKCLQHGATPEGNNAVSNLNDIMLFSADCGERQHCTDRDHPRMC